MKFTLWIYSVAQVHLPSPAECGIRLAEGFALEQGHVFCS